MAVNWVDRVPTRANRVLVTPEDGSTPYYATITRADEPSVVGTPINAANLNAMQEGVGLSASKYVYVSTTGSDTAGTGSQAAPFATITKALSTIPKNLNGFEATIYIAAGTYPENVLIRGFTGGVLRISGEEGSSFTISGMEVILSQFVEVRNIAMNISGSYLSLVGANMRIHSPFTASGGQYGANTAFYSNLIFLNTATISNTTNYAVVASSLSKVYVATLAGSGNKMSVACTLGGNCVLGSDTMTSSGTQYFTDTGGRILAGSQTQVPNY